MTQSPVKTQRTDKRGGKRSTSWKPGQSGNPKGAPKRGDSWAETIKAIGEMDGPTVAQLWDTKLKEFQRLPDNISLKQLVTMTVYASLLREVSPGTWRELMDRAEGPVKAPPVEGDIHVTVRYADTDQTSSEPTGDQE